MVTEYDQKYQELADMNRRIFHLENKDNISDVEGRELEILEMARDYERKNLSEDVMAREG